MTDEANSQEVPASVECRATKDPAVRRFIFAVLAVGLGVYCFIDHYIRNMYQYPEPYELNPYLTYLFNHYGPFVLIPVGLLFAAKGVIGLRRTLVADQEGIGYVGGQKIGWSAVKSLDSENLASKGILNVTYDTGAGEKTLVLDSWKLQNFRDLVRMVESKVSPDTPSE